jgi:hypothetical protein
MATQRWVPNITSPGSGKVTLATAALPAGSHTITVIYGGDTNDVGSTSNTVTQTVIAKPVISTTSLGIGTTKSNYSATLAVSGGLAPCIWSIPSGSLPNWLSLNISTGLISGKPSATGTFNFTVKVTDSLGNTATQGLSITVTNK